MAAYLCDIDAPNSSLPDGDVSAQIATRWPVVANSTTVASCEEFDIVVYAGDLVSIKSCHRRFLTANSHGEITAGADFVGRKEIFRKTSHGHGTVTFQTCQGKYIVATESGGLVVAMTPLNASHKFSMGINQDGKHVLQSSYGKFVTAGKLNPHLVAKQTVTPHAEGMRQVDLGAGKVAFMCAQGTYLTAHRYGIVSANGYNIGKQETFQKIEHEDGTVSLKTFADHYLSCRRSGRVTSDAITALDWEKFHLVKKNIALGMPVTTSSAYKSTDPWNANDGAANHGTYAMKDSGVCAQTENETSSWISVDLVHPTVVSSLMLVGSSCDLTDCHSSRPNWTIRIGYYKNASDLTCTSSFAAPLGAKVDVKCDLPHPKGRFITIWSDQRIILCELEAYEDDGTWLLRSFQKKYVAAVPASLREDTVTDLRNAGYGPESLKAAGHSAKELMAGGFTYSALKDVGFTFSDLYIAGFGPADYGKYKWISTTPSPKDPGTSNVACAKWHPFVWKAQIPADIPWFKGLPPRQHWEQIWNDAHSNKSGNLCTTPVIAIMPLGEASRGFCSDMNNFVNEALVAMYARKPLSICAQEDARNLWAESFVNPGVYSCRPCTVPKSINYVAPGAWMAGAFASITEASAGHEREASLVEIKRFLAKKLFALKPEVLSALDALQADLGLNRKPYVGVHIRRGDKIAESSFRPTEDFAAEAERLCLAIGANKIFLASDDSSELEKLRSKIMSDDIEVVEQPRLPEETYAERGSFERTAERVLLNDVFLLIRANGYVGTASSNVDRFVWFLRDPTTQSISLDDGGDYLFRSC